MKKPTWFFSFQKYGKLGHFIKHKPLISEDCLVTRLAEILGYSSSPACKTKAKKDLKLIGFFFKVDIAFYCFFIRKLYTPLK